MSSETLRKRGSQMMPEPLPDLGAGTVGKVPDPHPAGEVKHAPWVQVLRLLLLATWFHGCLFCIMATQYIGAPLYWINKDYFYAYMAWTKQSFGIVLTTLTNWFSPTLIRVSWESGMRGQFRKTEDGRLETNFPERLVLISNHQIYTDWLYLWWIAYTSGMHGHIYIILKESLKYIPIIGPGMMFYGFIFMSRKWSSDKPRMQHRLRQLKGKHAGPLSGTAGLDPMWLMIFPEGTNLSANTRKRSLKWAESQSMPDLKYQLLPRSTGLQFCLEELAGTVDWVYDCTMAYEGTPPGGYAQDFFTVRSIYFQGRPPRSVNMYWRRFAVKDIPISDHKAFEEWMLKRWQEKDEILRGYFETGRFPSGTAGAEENAKSEDGYVNTEVRLRSWIEIGQIFVGLASLGLVLNVIGKLISMFR